MDKDIVVYSAIFGNTDPLHEPRNPGNVRFVMFTDQDIRSDNWEIVRVSKSSRPKRLSRMYKQPSHEVFPEYEYTLWVDASFTLLANPLELLEQYPHQMTAFKHHKRSRITDECEAIIAAGKGLPDATREQLRAYKADGWDTDENPQQFISNGGFLIRRNCHVVNKFNDLWNDEVQTKTLRDQMSIDYCADKAGLKIHHFSGTVPKNPYARIHHIPSITSDF